VIKIERPGTGDDTRQWGPPFWNGESTQFQAVNRNKESVALDLKDPLGREALLRLVERADIFVQNYRPGVLDRLGFDYESLSRLNPRLIYCCMSAFGSVGPLKDLPGYDPLMQAYSGIMRINGEEGRPPIRVSNSLVDQGTAMWSVTGILSALFQRAQTGQGCRVDTSLFETAMAWMPTHIQGYLATGKDPRQWGSGMSFLAPYQAFATKDGHLMVAVGNDNLWQRLCLALKQPELAADGRFATNPLRVENRTELEAQLAAIFLTGTNAHWEGVVQAAGVPCARLQSVSDAVNDPQTAAAGILQGVPHSAIDHFRVVGLPIQFDGQRPVPNRAPPSLGADTKRVLQELGMPITNEP
jgi:crotonobetainyl-CoA:carnitine CoA-transferase CaiB-like acyl-CoA transferase